MLLHKSCINVVITNILIYRKVFYSIPRQKCKITNNRSERCQKGHGAKKCPTGNNVNPSKFCYVGPKENIYVEKSQGSSDVSGIIIRYRFKIKFHKKSDRTNLSKI